MPGLPGIVVWKALFSSLLCRGAFVPLISPVSEPLFVPSLIKARSKEKFCSQIAGWPPVVNVITVTAVASTDKFDGRDGERYTVSLSLKDVYLWSRGTVWLRAALK